MTILGFHSTPELAMFLTSLLTGITMVMGVNAVNSAPSFMLDYYKYIGKDADATPQFPSFWGNVLNFYTVVTLVAQTIHEPTNLTSFMCRFSLLFRLEVSVLLMIVELVVIVLLPHTGASEVGAMAALVIVAYLGGAARAYFENTGYALFGPCPSKMLSGMLVGSATSGALVSIIQIILMAAMPSTHSAVLTQSILYFSLSLGIIFGAGVLLIGLLFNPFAKQYIAEFRSRRSPLANIYRPLHDEDRKRLHELEVETSGTSDDDHPTSCPNNADIGGSGGVGTDLRGDTDPNYTGTTPAAKNGGRVHAPFAKQRGGVDDDDDILFDDRVPSREEDGFTSSAAGDNGRDVAVTRTHKHSTANAGEVRGAIEPANSLEGDLDLNESSSVNKSAVVGTMNGATGDNDALARAELMQALTTSEVLQGVRLWPVLKKIWPMMLSCLLTFLITYLMYPGLLFAVDAEDSWYTTIVISVYNFGDLVGRATSMWKRTWPSRKVILIGSIARVVFIPLLVLCALGKIPGHAPAYVFTALLAVSNGFFGTLSMVYAPETKTLKTDGERAMAGQANGVCLLLGCSVGSLLQLAIVLPFN